MPYWVLTPMSGWLYDAAYCWFYIDVSDWRPNLGVGLKEQAETIVSECQQRVKEIDAILTDINRMEKESQLAALKALAIPDQSDKLMRYERHITKQLHDALDRLQPSSNNGSKRVLWVRLVKVRKW